MEPTRDMKQPFRLVLAYGWRVESEKWCEKTAMKIAFYPFRVAFYVLIE